MYVYYIGFALYMLFVLWHIVAHVLRLNIGMLALWVVMICVISAEFWPLIGNHVTPFLVSLTLLGLWAWLPQAFISPGDLNERWHEWGRD